MLGLLPVAVERPEYEVRPVFLPKVMVPFGKPPEGSSASWSLGYGVPLG